MSVQYTISLATFPSGLDVDRFIQEIRDSSITIALDYIDTDATNAYVWFKVSLSGGEQTTLNNLASAHSGEPLPGTVNLTVTLDDLTSSTVSGLRDWDRDSGGILALPRGTAFPGAPTNYEVFYRTDQSSLYVRTPGGWVGVSSTVASVFGRTGTVVAVSGDYTASQVSFTPNGDIAATNVQTAIQEVRDEASTKHKTLRHLVHLADRGPFEGFTSGAYAEALPSGNPFPTSFIWWVSSAKTQKIVELTVTYNSNKTVATKEWKGYDTDGTTLLATVTDTYTYSGSIFTEVTRTIA